MALCERVSFVCPGCGHEFPAVLDSDERCALCGRPVAEPPPSPRREKAADGEQEVVPPPRATDL